MGNYRFFDEKKKNPKKIENWSSFGGAKGFYRIEKTRLEGLEKMFKIFGLLFSYLFIKFPSKTGVFL